MNNYPERRLILEMIDSGKISADEGLGLLKALDEAQELDVDSPPELLGLQEGHTSTDFPEPEILPGPDPATRVSLPPDA